MSSIFGLNIALSAIRAQQYAMDVTGHNIANANTPGYRRQEAILIANDPMSGSFGTTGVGMPQLGTGVLVHSVRRAQTDFLDTQVRTANQWMGTWDARNTALGQLEPLLAEPGDAGLSAAINRFWNSWYDLSAAPESLPSRVAVVESGVALADRIQTLHHDLRALQVDTDGRIAAAAHDINAIAAEIAGLNEQITQPMPGVYQPNDLLDRRSELLEKLSQLVRIEVYGQGGVDMIVSVGGRAIIQGNQFAKIDITTGPTGMSQLVWAEDGSEVLATGGELKGLMEIRDDVVGSYLESLDDITEAIITRVNAIHSTGITMSGAPAGNFFVPGTTSADIAVNPALTGSPSEVAAGVAGNGPGDNWVADSIAKLGDEALIGTETIGSAYSALVAQIGSHAEEARMRTEMYTISLNQRRTQRESIAGVSIDEEMVNMVKFQQAYNAAARIFTVIDEMTDLIINRMGIAGR